MDWEEYEHIFQAIRSLAQNVDGFFQRFQQRYGAQMQCQEGCSACCYTSLTVFPVEAAWIIAEVETLFQSCDTLQKDFWRQALKLALCGQKELRVGLSGKIESPCVFLHENKCLIYSYRPIVCRSQGLPLRYQVAEKKDEICYAVSFCPKNFQNPKEFPPQADWLELDRLNTLLSLAQYQFAPSAPSELLLLCDANGRISLQKVAERLLQKLEAP